MKDYTVRPLPAGWQENVVDVQNAQYPKCKHGTPTPGNIRGQAVCLQCLEEDPALLTWLKSGSLVSGGLT